MGLTKTVAREWGAFNIRCNAIAYGFIATRLTGNKDEGATISVNGEKVQNYFSFLFRPAWQPLCRLTGSLLVH